MLAVGDERPQSAKLEKARHGGARPGAGRKQGGRNALPMGCVAAIKAAGLRVPAGAPVAHKNLADRALQRMADVLEGAVRFDATAVLVAARAIREEVCGPVPKRLEHSGPDGEPLNVTVNVLPPESE